MDYDPAALAKQLRKPEGAFGRQVGEKMAELTAEVNYAAIDRLDIGPEEHVLEIGFGPGTGIMEACRLTPRGFVAGIDHSPEMLTLAQEHCSRELIEERAELAIGDASELPYADGSFHKAFAVNVAHFWDDPAKPLREILRVLKPGGRLVLFLTHHASWPAGLKESGQFHAREAADWEGIVRQAGFADVRSETKTYGDVTGFCVIAERSLT